MTVATCVPYDPESKGGSEATVRIAKADLVPTEANLRPEYSSWNELVVACEEFMRRGERPGAPGHPADAERDAGRRGHPPPPSARRGLHRRLRRDPSRVVVGHHQLRRRAVLGAAHLGRLGGVGSHRGRRAGRHACGRTRGERSGPPHSCRPLVIPRSTTRTIRPGHPERSNASPRRPTKPNGPSWPWATGPTCGWSKPGRPARHASRSRWPNAVSLARLHGNEAVDVALGQAALYGRFAEGDLASFIAAQPHGDHHSASEDHSLQGGTSAWKGFGT